MTHRRKRAHIIVLDALFKGAKVTIGDKEVVLGEDEEGNSVLCVENEKFKFSTKGEKSESEKSLHMIDVSFAQFLKACSEIDDEELQRLVHFNVMGGS